MKRASLDLSVNAIVVLILAVTMLGLGLAFMRDMFGKTTEQLDEVSDTLSQQIIDEIEEQNARLYFKSTDLKTARSEETYVYYGVRNDLVDSMKFSLNGGGNLEIGTGAWTPSSVVACYDALDSNVASDPSKVSGIQGQGDIQFEVTTQKSIKQNEIAVMKMKVKAGANAAKTTYYCAFVIDDPSMPDSEYARQDFFVTIEK